MLEQIYGIGQPGAEVGAGEEVIGEVVGGGSDKLDAGNSGEVEAGTVAGEGASKLA